MPALNTVKFFLFIAVCMFAAKPFLGFKVITGSHPHRHTHVSIVVKAFSKRKQEFNEDSEFNIYGIQKRLADPALPSLLLFAAALAFILPVILNAGKNITSGFLSRIKLHLYQPQARYLLAGQLII